MNRANLDPGQCENGLKSVWRAVWVCQSSSRTFGQASRDRVQVSVCNATWNQVNFRWFQVSSWKFGLALQSIITFPNDESQHTFLKMKSVWGLMTAKLWATPSLLLPKEDFSEGKRFPSYLGRASWVILILCVGRSTAQWVEPCRVTRSPPTEKWLWSHHLRVWILFPSHLWQQIAQN